MFKIFHKRGFLERLPGGFQPLKPSSLRQAAKLHKERRKFGFDSRATWSLDSEMLNLAYERLMLFREHRVATVADRPVEVFGEMRPSFNAVLDELIELSRLAILSNNGQIRENDKYAKDFWNLWAEVHHHLWW